MNKPTIPEELLTVREVAKRLHLHPNTVRQWSNRGLLRAYRVGRRRDRRISTEEVLRLLSSDGSGPPEADRAPL